MKHILAIAALLACSCTKNEKETNVRSEKAQVNRFRVQQLSDMRRDQVLIDTATGRIWHKLCMIPDPKDSAGCEYNAWMLDDIEAVTHTKQEIYSMTSAMERMKTESK